MRSFTFGAFDLDGLLSVSHGWFLLLLDLLSQSGGENKEETDWGIVDCRFENWKIEGLRDCNPPTYSLCLIVFSFVIMFGKHS